MNSPKIDPELLSRYIEGELSESETRKVDQMLARSSDARSQLESLRKMLVTLERMPDLAPPSGFLQRLDEKIALQRRGWQRLLDWLVLKPLPVPARASVFILIITLGTIGLLNGGRWIQYEKSVSSVMIAKEPPVSFKAMGYIETDRKADRYGDESIHGGKVDQSLAISKFGLPEAPQPMMEQTSRLSDVEIKVSEEKKFDLDDFVSPETTVEYGLLHDAVQKEQPDFKEELGSRLQPVESERMTAGLSMEEQPVLESPSAKDKVESQVPASQSVAGTLKRENLFRSRGTYQTDLPVQSKEEEVPQDLGMRAPMIESQERYERVPASSAGNYFFGWDAHLPDEIDLSISSIDPVQTVENLQKGFEQRGWSWDQGEPQSATDTKTLRVWVAKDEVGNATRMILAMAEEGVAGVSYRLSLQDEESVKSKNGLWFKGEGVSVAKRDATPAESQDLFFSRSMELKKPSQDAYRSIIIHIHSK